jgi:chromosome segregation ATPase
MGDVGDDLEQVEERALSYAVEVDSLRKAIKSLQTQLASAGAERDQLANELVTMTNHCGRQREQLESLSASRDQLAVLLSNAQCAHDLMQRQSQELQAEVVAKHNSDIAITDAYAKGLSDGKTWAFREVHHWLRPFHGLYPCDEPAALLDAVPGLVKRLAECEGVTI